MSRFKKSVVSRSVELLNTARKIAGHELSQKIKETLVQNVEEIAPEQLKTRIEQAKILAKSLSQLKGAAMKVGQLLSLDSSDLLPSEVTEILSKLQDQAEPVDYSIMHQVLENKLDPLLLANLKIEEKPFASASIGQVHKATYKNETLALKIQYPGVRDSIHSDLAILQKVCEAFLRLSGRQIPLNLVFQEFTTVLVQETDYIRERNLMIQYQRHLEENHKNENYIVPHTINELCTDAVLSMNFVEGVPLKKWIDSAPILKQREHIARLILDLYCEEFFNWGLVQTDPNYGNFLVQNNTKLVLLDFGATMQYEKVFVDQYCQVLMALDSGDDERILETSIQFHLIDPRESDSTKRKFIAFLKNSLEPFSPDLQPFHFANKDYAQRSFTIGRDFTNSLKYSAPPKHILLLHRKLGGIFNILRRMDVTIDLVPYWKKMLQTKN
ncbi:MAG: AarF/ABC1/UbiB kinase family protein [Bdellovibrionaceae bacterium]|nr:AarF/ABC1/UbiB kinase family protein [Pseudobdellovibrionaceae bacterium]